MLFSYRIKVHQMLQADKQVLLQRMMPLTLMQQRVTAFMAIPILYKLLHLHLCRKLEFNLRYFSAATAFLTNYNVTGNRAMYSPVARIVLMNVYFPRFVYFDTKAV